MYDVLFGKAVVMTVTLEAAAVRLMDSLDDASSYGFQTEGIKASVIEVDRESPEATEQDSYYGLNSDEALEYVRGHDDPNDVRRILLLEREHPRYEDGRTGVIDKTEEYLGDLGETHA